MKYTIIKTAKTTKTTYCPKKLITNNYLLTIRRTSKNIFSKNVYPLRTS